MKNKLIVFSAMLLASIMVAGGTFAWFTSSPEPSLTNVEMETAKVEVLGNELNNISVRNIGTCETYIRVLLVPQWSDHSLSVSNVDIDINTSDWTEEAGYYYYRNALGANEKTTNIVSHISIDGLTPEYEGENLTLKIVAEGVQSANEAWKEVWGIDSLPF